VFGGRVETQVAHVLRTLFSRLDFSWIRIEIALLVGVFLLAGFSGP